MQGVDGIGLEQFLKDYPAMAIRPSPGNGLRLKGTFAFSADHPAHGRLTDAFALQIDVPSTFPRDLPSVVETSGRIPREGDFHVNGDGSLCLGSHLRLLVKLNESPSLSGFASSCVVPYLYAISLKLKHGGRLVFGELAHYGAGMLRDYAELFSLPTVDQARYALEMLGTKKRIANKRMCPCGCAVRLGRCGFNQRLRRFRKLAFRSWFKNQLRLALVQ